MRVSTFPTLHGERAVVRLFAAEDRYLYLADLGLPAEIETALHRHVHETSGAILLTGPAGSGKTTTAYACLREIVRSSQGRRSIVTLEDPIEMALPGVSQSQVQPAAGFTLATGLRSLMRQDPEVILVGEIRDAETVQTVFQAALTGHLVISTFHAGSAAGAISRLLDMGIEPYLLTSGLRAVLHQRLVRRLCECAQGATPGCPALPPHRLPRPPCPGRNAPPADRPARRSRFAAPRFRRARPPGNFRRHDNRLPAGLCRRRLGPDRLRPRFAAFWALRMNLPPRPDRIIVRQHRRRAFYS